MGKKKATSTATKGTRKTKATWLDDIVAIFCHIARKEVAKGNRPVHQETGFGWDPVKKTVDASAEWWTSKIKSNPEYRKFRDVGINPDMMNIYDQMFKGRRSSRVLEDFEHDEDEDPNPVEDIQGRGKKRTTMEMQTNGTKDKCVLKGANGKKGRVGGAAKLSKQIDRLVEVVESRSTATSIPTSAQATSIQEVMQVVATLPGAKTGTKLWWFATELFCSQEKREMFSIMTDADLKLQFLTLNKKKADPSFVM
ncbi:PREDICTED: uncharacterized protein LOC101306572 [Fragaria vesca subsp. vesca]|uniref:uncharacterized protein LOC101306572 n=1 Tax=Fragaria vesca subsp. vesca TaxID=101020 RepID=UPI0002C308C2|nr:PREDICTED: uncharacterized protein LOC101306572 [Fragaria vesca subsp. vesca]